MRILLKMKLFILPFLVNLKKSHIKNDISKYLKPYLRQISDLLDHDEISEFFSLKLNNLVRAIQTYRQQFTQITIDNFLFDQDLPLFFLSNI